MKKLGNWLAEEHKFQVYRRPGAFILTIIWTWIDIPLCAVFIAWVCFS